MHIHAEVLTRLFTALDRHDHPAMAACYAENASFRDIAFNLKGKTRIHAMWHMICDGDIKTTFKIDEVDDRTAFVTVVDDYTFRAKGRKVHNVIQSRFRFANGAIVEQHDSCDSRKWASMAIGGVGGFLAGRISPLRQAKARRTLDTFIEKHPQYQKS
jgi:ketosteroid isomerase-like protein